MISSSVQARSGASTCGGGEDEDGEAGIQEGPEELDEGGRVVDEDDDVLVLVRPAPSRITLSSFAVLQVRLTPEKSRTRHQTWTPQPRAMGIRKDRRARRSMFTFEPSCISTGKDNCHLKQVHMLQVIISLPTKKTVGTKSSMREDMRGHQRAHHLSQGYSWLHTSAHSADKMFSSGGVATLVADSKLTISRPLDIPHSITHSPPMLTIKGFSRPIHPMCIGKLTFNIASIEPSGMSLAYSPTKQLLLSPPGSRFPLQRTHG